MKIKTKNLSGFKPEQKGIVNLMALLFNHIDNIIYISLLFKSDSRLKDFHIAIMIERTDDVVC